MPLISLAVPKTQVLAGETIDFVVTAKTILGTDITKKSQYQWDFNGDGKVDRKTDEARTTYIYQNSGNYTAKVKVTYNVGAMADKDLAPMLARITPLIDKWYFTDLPTPRAATGEVLRSKWEAINTRKDATANTYAKPELALQAAIKRADPADRIVVFGSFYTVGGILKDGIPRLLAPHLAS